MIVDDEAPARARLRDLLADAVAEVPNEVVAEAANGQLALAWLDGKTVDLVLIDIRMPTMDGIELARHLARFEAPPAIVFVTAYDMHAVQAFELNAIDYLLKPVRLPRLLAALQKVQQRHPAPAAPALEKSLAPLQTAGRSHLSCHERGRLLLIPVADILYFQADLKYVTARTAHRSYLLDESLSGLEDEFPARFIRLHRSVLVAREAIIGFEKNADDEAETQWQALLRDVPERMPVSRRQWPQLKSYAKKPGS